MSRRRHEVGGGQRKPTRPKSGRGPARRRRFSMSRMSTRGSALIFLGTAVLAIGAVAIAGAISSGGGNSTLKPEAASTPSAVATSSPTPSASPRGPLPASPVATHTPSPRPQVTSSPTPVVTPSPAAVSPKPAPKASRAHCPSAAKRVQVARQLLQHRDALPQQVTVITAGPRQGLLGSSDFAARTLTLYVRTCTEEPLIQIASVWGYEAGQFIKTEAWDAATRSHWNQLRGSSFTSSTQFKQDAASVYAFWQTGTTRYWQSPVAPPSYKQLSSLVPYLKTS